MATDNAVIPNLVMVLMVLMVLRDNRKRLNTPTLNNPLMIEIDRFVLNLAIFFVISQKFKIIPN